jgi:hypothetical protein
MELDVDWRIILKQIFKIYCVRVQTELKWLRECSVAGSCEDGNEHSGSIKGSEFLD